MNRGGSLAGRRGTFHHDACLPRWVNALGVFSWRDFDATSALDESGEMRDAKLRRLPISEFINAAPRIACLAAGAVDQQSGHQTDQCAPRRRGVAVVPLFCIMVSIMRLQLSIMRIFSAAFPHSSSRPPSFLARSASRAA